MNCTVSFIIEKHIYVEDVKDNAEAVKKASGYLLDVLNRGGITHFAKINIEMQPEKKKEDKNVKYSVL